ncbi:MAG TPA: ankyrin repeat domain-containing protein, partial [Longimicrobium sp.]|nr:ankyrin repeat domain-containing protein [Longimicrobium sp.]
YEPCPVTLDSITPPDTIRTLLTRAATLGAGGRADELRATDWSYRDPQGRNAVHWSARVGHQAATRGLVLGRAAADLPDHDGVTPLMVAAGRADAWHVEFLLGNRANPNAANAEEQTPLMYLAASCAPVLAAAADTTLPHTPETALLRLAAAGADLDAQDIRGNTALMHATRGSGLRVRDLLAAGANPHLEDRRGRSTREVADGPYSADGNYIQSLIGYASYEANWSALPPEQRERYFEVVDTRYPRRRERDEPSRLGYIVKGSDYIPDSILPYRP